MFNSGETVVSLSSGSMGVPQLLLLQKYRKGFCPINVVELPAIRTNPSILARTIKIGMSLHMAA